MKKAIGVLGSALVVLGLAAYGDASRAAAAAGAEPQTSLEEVGAAIMSPACPGKLLINCPSGEGAQLRELVRRKIAAGESKDQIVRYFVDVYGIEVLPNPPPEGFYLTAWLLPFAGLVAGFGVFFVLVRSWSQRSKARVRGPSSPKEGGGERREGEDPLETRLRRELEEFES